MHLFSFCYTYIMSIDWTKIYKKYKGMWVALAEDEITVVGSGKTAKEAHTNAQKNGNKIPILTHMPDNLSAYVGGV